MNNRVIDLSGAKPPGSQTTGPNAVPPSRRPARLRPQAANDNKPPLSRRLGRIGVILFAAALAVWLGWDLTH